MREKTQGSFSLQDLQNDPSIGIGKGINGTDIILPPEGTKFPNTVTYNGLKWVCAGLVMYVITRQTDIPWDDLVSLGVLGKGLLHDREDGLLARNNPALRTEAGKKLDPLADKIVTTMNQIVVLYLGVSEAEAATVVYLLISVGAVAWNDTLSTLQRYDSVTDIWPETKEAIKNPEKCDIALPKEEKERVGANWGGKIKTALFHITSIGSLLAFFAEKHTEETQEVLSYVSLGLLEEHLEFLDKLDPNMIVGSAAVGYGVACVSGVVGRLCRKK